MRRPIGPEADHSMEQIGKDDQGLRVVPRACGGTTEIIRRGAGRRVARWGCRQLRAGPDVLLRFERKWRHLARRCPRADLSPCGGPQNPGLGTLPPRSLDAVSLNAAVDCVSALRVTQRTVSRQGGVLGTQAVDAIKQAEAIFYERAQTQAGRQEEAGTDLSVAIERKTQLLLESPSDAAQHALACLRTLSGST